ncbi:hypothetical protein KI387_009900, partial [Taxus chinensis]
MLANALEGALEIADRHGSEGSCYYRNGGRRHERVVVCNSTTKNIQSIDSGRFKMSSDSNYQAECEVASHSLQLNSAYLIGIRWAYSIPSHVEQWESTRIIGMMSMECHHYTVVNNSKEQGSMQCIIPQERSTALVHSMVLHRPERTSAVDVQRRGEIWLYIMPTGVTSHRLFLPSKSVRNFKIATVVCDPESCALSKLNVVDFSDFYGKNDCFCTILCPNGLMSSYSFSLICKPLGAPKALIPMLLREYKALKSPATGGDEIRHGDIQVHVDSAIPSEFSIKDASLNLSYLVTLKGLC